MPLIKSNSVLVGIDSSSTSSVISENTFSFLNFIQSISLDIKTNRLNHKFIGSKDLITNQYVMPEVNINLTYLQRVDFLNEILFGFNCLTLDAYESALYKFFNDFKNKNLYLLLANNNNDIVNVLKNSLTENVFNNYLTSSNLINDLIVISLANIYISNYSFSYKIGSTPLVNCSFSASDLKISNPQLSTLQNLNVTKTLYSIISQNQSDEIFKEIISNTYFPTTEVVQISKANGDKVAITSESILNFIQNTNENTGKNIVYHMKNLTFSNTFSSTNLPGEVIDTFENSVIQNIDISINFNRQSDYFFKKMSDQKAPFPIKRLNIPTNCNIKISGLCNKFNISDLTSLYKTDSTFNMSLILGNADEKNSNTGDFTEMKFEKLTLENFSYSIDINDFLKYSMEFTLVISDVNGLKLIKESTKGDMGINFISSDGSTFQDSDGNLFYLSVL